MCKESLINSNSVHLGPRTGLPDKILKGDHQMIILAKLESNGPSSLRGEKIKFHPPFLFFSNSGHVGWMSGLPDTILKGGHQRTKQSLVPIGAVVSEMKIFKISSPILFLVTATMLVGGRDCRAQFWKGITHGPFHQSLVLSGQVVSEENIFSNCVRTDDRRKVMTKAQLTQRVR